MERHNIPELYNTAFMDGYLLNINGTAGLVYEVNKGDLAIEDNLECIISCRKQTQEELENKSVIAQDMFYLQQRLEGKDKTTNYSSVWEIDISYKVLNVDFEKIKLKVQKMEDYGIKNKVVLYSHGVSSAKQMQSFYPGFVETNDHLYCITEKKCLEILHGCFLDLSSYLPVADGADMIQIYIGCASGKVFAAFSFFVETNTRVKYKDVFTKIYETRQEEFDRKISEKKSKIESFLREKVNFSYWKQLNTKTELQQIFGANYEFSDKQFSFDTESGRKYGQIVSISDLTSKVLSKGFL